MEMLIVVAIIAVLVAIAIPTFNQSLEKSRQAVDMANARSLKALLATMVMDGQIEFEGAKGNQQAGTNVIGAWVLVTKDAKTRPAAYNQTNMRGTMYCGTNLGVQVNGESTDWNRENTAFRAVVENSIGTLRSHSGGGDKGWAWYLVEYVYNVDTGSQDCFVYAGDNGGESGYGAIKDRIPSNRLTQLMQGSK